MSPNKPGMSNYKTRSFQAPEVNWLGNWSSNESLNKEQAYVKTANIYRHSESPNRIKFVVDPQNRQFTAQLPPKSSPRCTTHSPTLSPSAAGLQRTCSNPHDTHFHKCENRACLNNLEQKQKPMYRTYESSYSTNSPPVKTTILGANFNLKSCNNQNLSSGSACCSSQATSRRSSASRAEGSPYTSIETITISKSPSQLSNRSASRAKYEDFRNQRSTRSYTPTVVIESNRNSPGRTVSILINRRNNKVFGLFSYEKIWPLSHFIPSNSENINLTFLVNTVFNKIFFSNKFQEFQSVDLKNFDNNINNSFRKLDSFQLTNLVNPIARNKDNMVKQRLDHFKQQSNIMRSDAENYSQK